MCGLVHKQANEAGALEDLEEPAWMNSAGEIVSTEAELFGAKINKILKHPKCLLFVDEVGNNTNMKDNGRVGGEWLLKARGQMAEVTAATSEACFAVLGFTAATREPAMRDHFCNE
jgi:hypothetical protein